MWGKLGGQVELDIGSGGGILQMLKTRIGGQTDTMAFPFCRVTTSFPKWPRSVRARAVIRVRKHHFGIFVC